MPLRRPLPVLLMVPLLAGAPARAQDVRWDPADQLLAVAESTLGGKPLAENMFRLGWPTDRNAQRLTGELSAVPAETALMAYFAAGEGGGLLLSTSALERDRLAKQQTIKDTATLLRQELSTYGAITNRPGDLPRDFDPVFLPYAQARANLRANWNRSDLNTYRWAPPLDNTVTLEGLAAAILGEARFARLALEARRNENIAGRDTPVLGDGDGRAALVGLLALHTALAQVDELRRMVLDSSREEIVERTALLELDEFRYYHPPVWRAELKDGVGDYRTTGRGDDLVPALRGQALLLLALSELADLTGPAASPRLRELFGRATLGGRSLEKLFDPDAHDRVVESALFVFRSARTLNVDIRRQKAVSLARQNEIVTRDLALYLRAIEVFLSKVKVAGRSRLEDVLKSEQGKGRTLLGALATSFKTWDQQEEGLYDSYSLRTDGRVSQKKSLETQGWAILGLISAQRVLSQSGDTPPYLDIARRLARWLDRELWRPKATAYLEDESAPLAGATVVLAALREMALLTGEGPYLLRYRQYLESLQTAGYFRTGEGKLAAAYAPVVTIQAGSK